MIKSYSGKETRKFVEGKRTKFPPEIIERISTKLFLIETATTLEDLLFPPSNRLELLRGDRAGQHSIRINQQWRVCFYWIDGCAYDVEITDYH